MKKKDEFSHKCSECGRPSNYSGVCEECGGEIIRAPRQPKPKRDDPNDLSDYDYI